MRENNADTQCVKDFECSDGSCVIQTHRLARHWYNYLWNDQGYCAQISESGHGASWCIDADAHLCKVNADGGRHLYVRDDQSGEFVVVGLDEGGYRCTHHLSHTTITADLAGILIRWRIFVPDGGTHEVWEISLENSKSEARSLSCFSLMSFDLDGFDHPRYYEMYRSCESSWVESLNGVYVSSSHPFAPQMPCQAFIASDRPVDAFDGDLLAFLGAKQMLNRPDGSQVGCYHTPRVVCEKENCTGSLTANFMLGGVLQHTMVLGASQQVCMTVVTGLAHSMNDALQVMQEYRKDGFVAQKVAAVEARDVARYGTLAFSCPDNRINKVCNRWLAKQVDFCLVGKKGVRDNLQIAVALLHVRPNCARDGILEVLAHQFKDGHAVLTWQPYDDTRYSDQPFWIIYAVTELIKETGDIDLLSIEVPYQDGGRATVMEHCKAASRRLMEDRGPHGLSRIFFADWNDALNVTTDPMAESVMLSAQVCLAFRQFARLCRIVGENSYAAVLEKSLQEFADVINTVAWDKDRYVRALHREGVIGGHCSSGSTAYLNAQTWAILGGVVDQSRLPLVLHTIDSMEHPFGFPLNDPPYTTYDRHVGRMSGMLPGLYENGGVYCHASAFKMLMDCTIGRPNHALQTLLKIMPDNEANPSLQSGAEPYVFTNCYATHPKYYGKSYQSWTTGTSAWVMMTLYEGFGGVKRDFDGLHIAPVLPDAWDSLEIVRTFRGCEWHISIERGSGTGKQSIVIEVDGVAIKGHILPLFPSGSTHEARVVIIGKEECREF